MSEITAADTSRLLALELGENDSGEPTVRAYLLRLLTDVWREEEGFDGKRPFGNSSWHYDLYVPMVKAGIITGKLDEDGCVEDCDDDRADELILAAIASLGQPS